MRLVVIVIVVMIVVAVVIAPPVMEAFPARVTRGIELLAIVLGLAAVSAVTVDVMVEAILPFVDVPVAGSHIVIRARGLHTAHEQQSTGESCGKGRVL